MAVMQLVADKQHDITDYIGQQETKSIKALGAGYKNARGEYRGASHLYDPYAETGLAAFKQYADASGVNGQGGYDRVVGNFRASPGYQYMVDQAIDGTARKASSLGALGSGNTMAAVSDRAGHMADQEYGDYLARLDNIGKTGFAATGAQATLGKGVGDLFAGEAGERSNAYRGYTGLDVGARMNTQQQLAEALQGGMMAGQNAAANKWNFGMQAVSGLAGLAGRMMGGGGFGG